MEGLDNIRKIREYCDYVEEHLLNVDKSWKILQDCCKDMNVIYDDFLFNFIDQQVKEHDLSKMSQEEFIPYQLNFFPVFVKDSTMFNRAWEHHLFHNPHHWESWTKISEKFPNEKACHCVCMVLDWMAMGMKFGDTAESYYEKNKDKINIPEWSVRLLSMIFSRLRGLDGKSS